jgi:alpha-tubulin suppressor-like RCC1 family protein
LFTAEELEVFAWGWNACGQTGQGHQEDCLRPAAIEVFRGQELLSLGAGATHSIAVTSMILKSNILFLCISTILQI